MSAYLDISGRITLGEGASALRNAVRAMAGEGHKKLLLNLSDVSYIDSSGLGVLVRRSPRSPISAAS